MEIHRNRSDNSEIDIQFMYFGVMDNSFLLTNQNELGSEDQIQNSLLDSRQTQINRVENVRGRNEIVANRNITEENKKEVENPVLTALMKSARQQIQQRQGNPLFRLYLL